MIERNFQKNTINELKSIFPGSIVLKTNSSLIQGIPDIIFLYKDKWALLEFKRSKNATRQPNQEYYINKANSMSYASFIYPENKEQVIHEMEQAFRNRR